MSNKDEKIVSMVLSEEEKRYFRALLAWEPGEPEELARKKAASQRPLAGQFRVLILGSKGCGKTAILTRFCKGSFTSEGQPPNPDRERGCQRKIEIKDQTYLIDALELAPSKLSEGQYLQHAVAITEAVVLIYDVQSRDSFALVQDLHQRIQEALLLDKRRHYGVVLVGNKADSDEGGDQGSSRAVTEGEGYELARSLGGGRTRCAFRETSARTGENVDNIFALLGTELLRLRRLTQQRQEQADGSDETGAMGQAKGSRSTKSSNKTAKWRVWARNPFRRASEDAARKAVVA
ncbi:putative ras-like protein 3 [Rosellinia necatrix]|uniref:small monomeric GTPase n=1 Tax=Rosellinia necatrix TaxID=77044 RepID=A0A1S7UL63_ROSNE|nr:putative ras-like protein 3 [Rosellinia necatrix]